MPFTVSVPEVAGVPPIFQTPGFASTIALLTSDLAAIQVGTPAWGIYLNGGAVITADTVISLDYRNESTISDYPVEQGAFESFDKVAVPFNARVRFAAGGSAAAREALLASISAIASDLNLYDVVTPEAVYSNANITHYDYQRRNENGRGLMVVDVWLEEIRQNATLSMNSTAAPSGADPVNSGTVQAMSRGGIGSDSVASSPAAAASANTSPVTTPTTSGGIGSASLVPAGAFANTTMLT